MNLSSSGLGRKGLGAQERAEGVGMGGWASAMASGIRAGGSDLLGSLPPLLADAQLLQHSLHLRAELDGLGLERLLIARGRLRRQAGGGEEMR